MKNLSIKTQLTFYYGFIMTLLVAFTISILFMYSEYEIRTRTSNYLYSQVHEAIQDITIKNQQITFGNDIMKLEHNIYLSVYDENKEMLYGRIPYSFECHDGFHMEMKKSVQDEITYLVYDFPFFPDGKTKIYIRGIANLSDAESSLRHIFQFSIVLLPAIVIISILIGYFLAKRALSPVATITNKVKQIMEHYESKERIALGSGKDEIYEMASTFDDLLDQIQTVIEREKQFSNDASHELRTPIAVILMQCDSLLDDDSLSFEQRHMIEVIHKKATSMHQLIAQLLLLSRADANRAKIEMEHIDLSELCEMTCEEQSEIAKQKNIHITTDITSNIEMMADMTLMIRLFVNLLSNAITYGKENGSIHVSLHQDNDSIILKVKDNGIGISKENIPKIFERFYQVDPSRSSSHSGLGLSMVKWISDVHHGQIQVDSILNEGTTFTITFPKPKTL